MFKNVASTFLKNGISSISFSLKLKYVKNKLKKRIMKFIIKKKKYFIIIDFHFYIIYYCLISIKNLEIKT